MKIKSILIILIVFLLIAFAISFSMYYYSINRVFVKEIQIGSLDIVSIDEFLINGNINLENKGVIPISFDKVVYNFTSSYDDSVLSTGILSGGKISPNKDNIFEFNQRVKWSLKPKYSWDYYKDSIYLINIEGNVYVKKFGLIEIKVPFRKEVNISTFIEQYRKNLIDNMLDNVLGSNQSGVKIVWFGN